MNDLHQALVTTEVKRVQTSSTDVELVLMRLQDGKDDIRRSLHAQPASWSMAGLQSTDVLSFLGFHRSSCPFIVTGECFLKPVDPSFDLDAFAEALPRATQMIQKSAEHFQACGILLPQPEGWGYFNHRPSLRRPGTGHGTRGDGHTGAKRQRMKDSEDDAFRYVFTWLESEASRGWTTHYRPKHPPLSADVEAAFGFLDLAAFPQCPEFDFERCYWHFTPYRSNGGDMFGGSANTAHSYVDANAKRFSQGIEQLVSANGLLANVGMPLFKASRLRQPGGLVGVKPPSQPQLSRVQASSNFEYDVALSFAGTERQHAERLARIVRQAGFRVFYDDFYPEQLWGENLVDTFDAIYRKESRYCVMFISNEYKDRMWTKHERRSAQARALEEKGQGYILPVRVEPVDLPGMPGTVGYLSLEQYKIEEIAEILIRRLQDYRQPNSARSLKEASVGEVGVVVPDKETFDRELKRQFSEAERLGNEFIDIRASDLHRAVGSYPGPNHRMPTCCAVMRDEMGPKDRVLKQPPKGNGASLLIRYALPRISSIIRGSS